jgi:transglutaminase-like putative cysteine protease
MLRVEWAANQRDPVIEVTTRVQTQSRSLRPGQGSVPALSDEERRFNLSATDLLPVDGLVKQTAEGIVRGKATDVDKARALYEWMVDNTYRNPETRGCGVGDVSWMLKTGNLNGKCADLNALFVAMSRSIGVPARDVYGIRVAPSQFGYKSLSTGSEIVTKAQHCRAEVWLEGSGWTPVDPADVRKVVLEEPPANLPLTNLKVMAARKTLFGAWEGNWLAFNTAHDVKLPGSSEPALPFLMYPQAADKSGLVDPLDPDAFKYKIIARELSA